MILGGLIELAKAAGDSSYLDEAKTIAVSAINLLTDACTVSSTKAASQTVAATEASSRVFSCAICMTCESSAAETFSERHDFKQRRLDLAI